jgi:hypothetical protein
LTFNRLWTWIAIALPALVALLVPLPAVDLAYQLRAGNEILASGALPTVDTWTFTVAGTPWVDQQWLAQVWLAAGHAAGGWELLAVLRAALVAAMTGVLIAVARERGASPRTSAILAMAAFALAAPALALRPQLFGVVLFAVLLWLVAARERHPRLYLIAPVVVAVWANVHGSFVIGPALLGYAWLRDVAAGRPSRLSFAGLLAGTLATLVNPFIAGAWAYAVGIGANPVIAGQVSEWQRTLPFAMPGLLFYPAVAATIVLGVVRRRSTAWPDWVLLTSVTLMGIWAVRGVAWWAPVMVLLVSSILARPREAVAVTVDSPLHRADRPSKLNTATAGVFGVLIVVALPWWRPADPLAGRVGLLTYAPSGLAAKLAELAPLGARVVVPQTWGSWFEWAVPDARYFIDSRFELFPSDVWADTRILAGGGLDAAEVLERREVELVVVRAMDPDPAGPWTVAWSDDDGRIFLRAHD